MIYATDADRHHLAVEQAVAALTSVRAIVSVVDCHRAVHGIATGVLESIRLNMNALILDATSALPERVQEDIEVQRAKLLAREALKELVR